MELQRKKEEASLATKRLMELLESRKASSRETGISGNGPGIQALMQAIEHELEVTVGVHGVRLEYQRQMEVSSEMAKENARLKEEAEMMRLNNTRNVSMSPAARSSRIFALKNMLATSSTTLVSTACQLSEAEERERVFSGKGRWNQVRSLPEAKNLMNFLFNLASSSRCSLREKEIICRDKDMEISDLKQKIVSLRCSLEQLKRQRSDSMRDSESDDYAVDATDDEWVPSPKFRKRKPKGGEHSSREKNHYSDISSDDAKDTQTASFVSCSCSRSSSCKTSRCVCIRMKIGCGSSCRCQETKCGNRVSRATENDSDTQGTELLQGTLVERPAEVKTDDGGAKKISF